MQGQGVASGVLDMNGYALDSNIISFWMKGSAAVILRFDAADARRDNVCIPPFAYYEVKRGLAAIHARARLRQLDSLCRRYPVGDMDNSILEDAVNIYAELKSHGWNIDEIDVFMAAWCKTNNFILVTNNTGHFARIPGLRLEDWTA